jgi:hypothetical protein
VSDEAHARLPRTSGTELTYEWFCRAVSVSCLVLGLFYWVRLIGLYEDTIWRFDLMPLHWQVAATVLSVLFPIAAIGLWMAVSWGPVIWVIAAAVEIAMYAGFPDMFGRQPGIVALHVATLIAFAGLRGLMFVRYLQRADSR